MIFLFLPVQFKQHGVSLSNIIAGRFIAVRLTTQNESKGVAIN